MLEPVGPLPPSVYWRRRCVALAGVVLVLALLVWGIVVLAAGDDTHDDAAPDPHPASFIGPGGTTVGGMTTGGTTTGGTTTGAPAGSSSDGSGSGRPSTLSSTPPGRSAERPTPMSRNGPSGTVEPSATPGTDRSQQAATTALPGISANPLDPRAALVTPPGGGSLLGRVAPEPTARAWSTTAQRAVQPCSDRAIRVVARTDKPRYLPGERPVLAVVITNTGPVTCTRDLDAARQAVAVVRTPGDGLWGSNDCGPGHTDDVRTLAPGQSATFSVRWSTRMSRPGCRGERGQVPAGAYELLARLDTIVSEPVPFILG